MKLTRISLLDTMGVRPKQDFSGALGKAFCLCLTEFGEMFMLRLKKSMGIHFKEWIF